MCIINKLNESADLTWRKVFEQFNTLVTPKQKVRGMVAYVMEPAVEDELLCLQSLGVLKEFRTRYDSENQQHQQSAAEPEVPLITGQRHALPEELQQHSQRQTFVDHP